MSYEIGSHFEIDDNLKLDFKQSIAWLPNLGDSTFTYSGRAAIELAIKDIKQARNIKSVYMPSYCCNSMIEPFVNNKINIEFYEVSFSESQGLIYNIDADNDCDIFFAMSYFGLERFKLDNTINNFIAQDKIIIEDITHRLLSSPSYTQKAHYCVASIRKWFPIATGGYITKNGSLYKKPNLNSEHLVKQKINAMYKKKKHLDGDNDVSKDEFLHQFKEFELGVKEVNSNYVMDDFSLKVLYSINPQEVSFKRRRNAKVLYEGIKKYPNIFPLIPFPDFEKATPLFVPIVVLDGKRDELQRELIQNNVYCPVHWPREKKINSIISNFELSLICDQRYSEQDMEYILDIIDQWYKKKF